jgi:hypothetical protein
VEERRASRAESVYEAEDEAIGAALESGELAEEGRRDDVVDVVKIVMVRQIDRIRSQPKLVMELIAYEGHMEVPIHLRIQREKVG